MVGAHLETSEMLSSVKNEELTCLLLSFQKFWTCGVDNNVNEGGDICYFTFPKYPRNMRVFTLSKMRPAMGGPTVIGREKRARRHPGQIEVKLRKVQFEREHLLPGQPPVVHTGQMQSDLKDSRDHVSNIQ